MELIYQQGNETRVRGSVRMTADGQVRWQYVISLFFYSGNIGRLNVLYDNQVSVYDGFTQWR